METIAHRRLKLLALEFLQQSGCRAIATEVCCPISRYRVDVAGYQDAAIGERGPPRRCPARTIVIECKQSRSDFLRDGAQRERLLALRAELIKMRRHIEEHRIKVHEPHLRRSGTSLFPELEEWDFASSRIHGYRQLVGRIADLEDKLYGATKFFTLARYRLADRLYLAAPFGMIRRGELPGGWGLLEYGSRKLRRGPGDQVPRGALHVSVEAKHQETRPKWRTRLLRNIAVAASRGALSVHMQAAYGELT